MKKHIIVLIGIILFWFGISFFSKAMFSGFHMIDDHQVVEIHSSLQKSGLIGTLRTWVLPEMQQRLKPLRITHQILRTYFFGFNYTAWAIHTILIGVITSFFLYLFGLKINFSRNEALLFMFLTLLGAQSIVWFHLGHDEMPGMFFLSFALFFMAQSVYSPKKKLLYSVLFVIFSLLSAFSKESFILMLPALAFWKNYLEKINKNISWLDSIKQNKFINGIFGIIFFTSIILICFVFKIDLGYAGISGITLNSYLSTVYDFLFNFRSNIKCILFAVLILILVQKDFVSRIKLYIKDYYADIIILLLIVLPQCFIYTKSGFFPRYLLPAILGYSYFIVRLIKYFNNVESQKFKKIVLNTIIAVCIVLISFNTYKVANMYALNGIYLYKTLDLVEKNTDKNSIILLVSDPGMVDFESTISMQMYLDKFKNRKNVYYLPIITQNDYTNKEFNKKLFQSLMPYFKDKTYNKIQDKNAVKAIVIFQAEKSIFNQIGPYIIDIKNYQKQNLWLFDVYIKK